MLKIGRGSKINPENFAKRKSDNESFLVCESGFNFLRDHFGLRPGCIHVILGTSGSGKTTLTRSVVQELLDNDKKILIYSSEESIADYETMFAFADVHNSKNLLIFHEDDMKTRVQDKNDISGFVKQLEIAFVENRPDVFVFDNLTTSEFYDQNEHGPTTASALQKTTREFNIPCLLIAHTSALVKDSMFFDSSCIRGYRTITNKAQYVYCYYRLRDNIGAMERSVSFVYTDKSRMHNKASKACYKLNYDYEKKMFTGDSIVGYEKLKKFLRSK